MWGPSTGARDFEDLPLANYLCQCANITIIPSQARVSHAVRRPSCPQVTMIFSDVVGARQARKPTAQSPLFGGPHATLFWKLHTVLLTEPQLCLGTRSLLRPPKFWRLRWQVVVHGGDLVFAAPEPWAALFAGYTTMSDKLDAKEVLRTLHEYFTKLDQVTQSLVIALGGLVGRSVLLLQHHRLVWKGVSNMSRVQEGLLRCRHADGGVCCRIQVRNGKYKLHFHS